MPLFTQVPELQARATMIIGKFYYVYLVIIISCKRMGRKGKIKSLAEEGGKPEVHRASRDKGHPYPRGRGFLKKEKLG